jgi:hypothetical protein
LFSNFEKFDPVTGEKTASNGQQAALANMEAAGEARKTRRAPHSKEETVKDAATGGSLSYLVGRAMNLKDSSKRKWLTSSRKHGALGLAAAGVAGAMSVKKQKSEYNRQQGAREFIVGKDTDRAKAYKNTLKQKYNVKEA